MKNSKQKDLFPSTLLSEDTLANLSPSQAEKEVKKIQDTSGQSILDLSKSCNQLGLLEKTLVDTLNSVSTPYLRTWRVKVTPQGRLVFQLRASVRTTKEKESGLWLTPSTTVISNRSPEAMEKRKKFRESIGRKTVNPGNLAEQIQYGNKTTDMKMWSTPQSTDGTRVNQIRHPSELSEKAKKGGCSNLREQVMWRTPDNMAGRPTGKMQKMLGNHPEVRKPLGGGTLNPMWVEWLMGYPPGFTDLNHLETVLFHKSPTTSDSVSSNRLMWPTPTVGMVEGGEQSHRVEKTKGGAYILRKKNKPNSTFGAKLSDAILFEEKQKMWPTPNASDGTRHNQVRDPNELSEKAKKGGCSNLREHVVWEEKKMWPTPTATDGRRGEIHEDGTIKKTWKKRRDKWAAKGVKLHRPLDIVVALEEEKKKKD